MDEDLHRRARLSRAARGGLGFELHEDRFADVAEHGELFLLRSLDDFHDARLHAAAPSTDRDDLRAHAIAVFDAARFVGHEEDRPGLWISGREPGVAALVDRDPSL